MQSLSTTVISPKIVSVYYSCEWLAVQTMLTNA